MSDIMDHKRLMAETRRTAESAVLMLPDDDPSKRFLLRIIERRTGIKSPARVGTDCTPPAASGSVRPQSDPGEPQDDLGGQPAVPGQIGRPRACGATQGLSGSQRQPRDLLTMLTEPTPKSDQPPPTVRNGKWVGKGDFDLVADKDLFSGIGKMVRDAGE